MKLDDMTTYGHDEVVDAVVVGTGAGGAPLLAKLAAAGLRVVAIEAGPNFDPEQFTNDEDAGTAINWMDERLSDGDDPNAFGPNNSSRRDTPGRLVTTITYSNPPGEPRNCARFMSNSTPGLPKSCWSTRPPSGPTITVPSFGPAVNV